MASASSSKGEPYAPNNDTQHATTVGAAGAQEVQALLGAALILIRFAFAPLMLAGCDVPPGCGPVSADTGGWPVQCSGMASLDQ